MTSGLPSSFVAELRANEFLQSTLSSLARILLDEGDADALSAGRAADASLLSAQGALPEEKADLKTSDSDEGERLPTHLPA